MLKGLRAIMATLVIILAGYDLLTGGNRLLPYMMMCAAILLLSVGLSELQKNKKAFWGYLSIVVFLFTAYISINLFITM